MLYKCEHCLDPCTLQTRGRKEHLPFRCPWGYGLDAFWEPEKAAQYEKMGDEAGIEFACALAGKGEEDA